MEEVSDQEKKEYYVPQIALWGRESSGKSWLLHAFERRINMIDDNIKRGMAHQDFRISLAARRENSEDDDLSQPSPTDDIVLRKILFHRQMLPSRSSASPSFQYKVNTHFHEIKVIDNQGQMLVPDKQKSGEPQEDQEYAIKLADVNKRRTDAAKAFAVASPNIIVVLDSRAGISDKLKEFVSGDLDYRNSRRYSFAVCLTKVDALGELDIQHAEEEQVRTFLIRQLGEDEQKKILDLIDELKNFGHDVKLFATSACGYYYNAQNKKRMSNIDKANNLSLADIAKWKPEGIEKPFFWLLEKIERNRIEEIDRDENPLLRLLWKSPMKSDRLSRYISYDSILHYAGAGERKSV